TDYLIRVRSIQHSLKDDGVVGVGSPVAQTARRYLRSRFTRGKMAFQAALERHRRGSAECAEHASEGCRFEGQTDTVGSTHFLRRRRLSGRFRPKHRFRKVYVLRDAILDGRSGQYHQRARRWEAQPAFPSIPNLQAVVVEVTTRNYRNRACTEFLRRVLGDEVSELVAVRHVVRV